MGLLGLHKDISQFLFYIHPADSVALEDPDKDNRLRNMSGNEGNKQRCRSKKQKGTAGYSKNCRIFKVIGSHEVQGKE